MCEWNLHEPDGWTAAVALFDQVRSDEGRIVTLTGQCTRCCHEMSVELPIEDRTGQTVTEIDDDQPLGTRAFNKIAYCNCVADHEGRPDDYAGCGAYGRLKIG